MNHKWLVVMLLSAVIVAPAFGDDASAKKKQGKKDRQRSMATQLIKRLEAVTLTDDQVAKIKELAKVADEKSKEIREQAGITNTMMKARREAQKSLKDSGKKGKELMAAVNQKAGFNDEQAKAIKEINTMRTKLTKDAIALLSDEQKENLPEQMKRALRKGDRKKKKAA
jgi:hypothetical protein